MITKYIKLKDEDYPVYFSTLVLAKLGDKYQLSMVELFELLSDGLDRLSLMQVYELAFLGFQAGSKKEKVSFPFADSEEFGFFLDDIPNWMETVFETFASYFPDQAEVETEGKAKKKEVKP